MLRVLKCSLSGFHISIWCLDHVRDLFVHRLRSLDLLSSQRVPDSLRPFARASASGSSSPIVLSARRLAPYSE